MLRLQDGRATLWEQMLPDQIQLMGPEFEAIDRLLDDSHFRAPTAARQAPLSGVFQGEEASGVTSQWRACIPARARARRWTQVVVNIGNLRDTEDAATRRSQPGRHLPLFSMSHHYYGANRSMRQPWPSGV